MTEPVSRGAAMKPNRLVGTLLAPALTGGRGVVGVAVHQPRNRPRGFRCCRSSSRSPPHLWIAGGGGERRQRRGRWLKKFLSDLSTSRASPSSTLKTRDSARGAAA